MAWLTPGPAASQTPARPPYRNPDLPVAERVRDLLGRMTLEEKFWQLYMSPGDLDDSTHDYSRGVFGLQIGTPAAVAEGAGVARNHAERINAIQRYFVEGTRLGVPIVPFDEALHGLMRGGATVFPQAIGLAATWDTALVGRVAAAIARETQSRGVRQVLSPVVNLADDVRWGRTEETYGEDPHLASAMGVAFVEAFERAGVVTTPKHFVANVGAGGRDSYPIDYSARLLDELHFPPFRAAIAAGARSIMTAYNSVDGVPATQNPWLLTERLRDGWGFAGFVISDAAATGGATVLHLTEPNTPVAAQHAWEAGLDVVFQSSWPQHRPYLDAVRRGLVAQSVVDSAVARVLRVKFALGLFDHPYVDPDSAAHWNGHAAHRALAREAARASLVLLKNDGGLLPLSRPVRSIAVIGADAEEARLGGYSGPGIAVTSILEGIRAAAGSGVPVAYAPGPGRSRQDHAVVPARQLTWDSAGRTVAGLRGEYFDNPSLDGAPRATRTDAQVDFRWTFNPPVRGLATDWYSARWTGRVTVPAGSDARIGVEGNDGFRLFVGGRLVVDRWRKESYRVVLAEEPLIAGRAYDVRLEFRESSRNGRVRLVWDRGGDDDGRAAVAAAVAAARGRDVAVVVVGIEEGEFRDRSSLGLPGHQEELVQAVAATGTPVVVVVVGGSAVTMSGWLDDVRAVLMAWYPGEEGGPAVADALFGTANPGGRLPITFPIAEGQLPLVYHHKPTGRGDDYLDLAGEPRFPFGFGLSYTTFAYTDLRLAPAEIGPGDTTVVRLSVRNVGDRGGDEVVQLYVRDVLASVAQPVMALKGFARVSLAPGEEREVAFRLGPEHLSLLDRDGRWRVEPGTFRVLVGSSSKDIRLRGEVVVR